MLRRFSPSVFLLVLSAGPLLAQATPDRVHYRDRSQDGKIIVVDGEIKESASGVLVTTPDKKVRVIAAPDLVRIDYGTVPGVERTTQLAAITLESGTDPAKTQQTYTTLKNQPGVAAQPKAKRYLEFRELYWKSRVVDAKAPAEFQAEGKKIADAALAYAKANLTSWESWSMAKLAARYYCELDDSSLAADAISALGTNKALTPELRHEAKLFEIGYLFRANKRSEAETIIKELAGDKQLAVGALRDRLAIFEEIIKAPSPPPGPKAGDPQVSPEELDARAAKVREAGAKIEAAIVKAKDQAARGAGYAALGEYYVRHGLLRDGMWAYLWVDVVYNLDRDEQVKAVNRLITIFGVLKDKTAEGEKDKAEVLRERLPRIRG